MIAGSLNVARKFPRVFLTEGTLDVHWKHALVWIASMEMVRERVLNGVGNILEVGVPCTTSLERCRIFARPA